MNLDLEQIENEVRNKTNSQRSFAKVTKGNLDSVSKIQLIY